MPKVGIEPTIPREHEFESCAYASSATSADVMEVYPRKLTRSSRGKDEMGI